ncbi:hypothetical protein EWM64_g4614 [Hericium alpestre]|uniref:Uncharacterized protein n=1 Tax=Hericium alpestre TaxID=135208 RepID=A0A4Z0A104_9AGAM|nr:hypothetical protein EWM64_g4614 [Hericium alpestre]
MSNLSQYQLRRIRLRTKLRGLIQAFLENVTGDPDVTMAWANYWEKIVVGYCVDIIGWRAGVPFKDFSTNSMPPWRLELLIQDWESGRTYFKRLSDEEYTERRLQRQAQIDAGEIEWKRKRLKRVDSGESRPQAQIGPDGGKRRFRYRVTKTPAYVRC